MHRWIMAMAMAVALPAVAARPGVDAVIRTAEATTLVTGSIEIGADGAVRSYELKDREQLPPPVRELIDKTVPTWRFQPYLVNGQPVIARSKLSLRMVANPLPSGDYRLSMRSASFDPDWAPGETVSTDHREQPKFPQDLIQERVQGTVYMLLKINRQGKVEDLVAEQVNLRIAATPHTMDRWRKQLAETTIQALKQWTFHIPDHGSSANANSWVARVPVNYSVIDAGQSRPTAAEAAQPGKWETYIPGPITPVPWLDHNPLVSGGIDAAADGSVQQVGTGLQLLTPLDRG